MSRFGSVPKSKMGEMRFPRGGNEDFDPTVKVSHMSKEEMEEYFKNRKGTKSVAKITKEAYQKLKDEGKSDADIAKRFGMTQANISYHKKNWYPPKVETVEKVNLKDMDTELRDLNNELIAENDNLKKQLEQSSVKVSQLEALTNELTQAKENLERELEFKRCVEPVEDSRLLELERENETLRNTLKVVL